MRSCGRRALACCGLNGFALDDDLWAKFQIPIGLAFFMLRERGQGVLALYPSPAGATESELHLAAWDELVAANPALGDLEAEVEALIVDRIVRAGAPRDRADRPLLRARRHDQVALGGHLRGPCDRRCGCRVLRIHRLGGRMSSAARPRACPRRAVRRRRSRRSSRCSGSRSSRMRPRRRCASAWASPRRRSARSSRSR